MRTCLTSPERRKLNEKIWCSSEESRRRNDPSGSWNSSRSATAPDIGPQYLQTQNNYSNVYRGVSENTIIEFSYSTIGMIDSFFKCPNKLTIRNLSLSLYFLHNRRQVFSHRVASLLDHVHVASPGSLDCGMPRSTFRPHLLQSLRTSSLFPSIELLFSRLAPAAHRSAPFSFLIE